MSDGELPNGWVVAPLGVLARNRDSERVPVNAKQRACRTGNVPYYGAAGPVGSIDEALFDEELLLVGEDGVQFLDPLKSKAYLVNGPAWVNNHAHVLASLGCGVSLTYLKYYLDQFDYHGYANGTTRLKLTRAAMDRIPVALPPADEQVRIVAELERRLSHIDAAERSLREALHKLKVATTSLAEAAVSGTLLAPSEPATTSHAAAAALVAAQAENSPRAKWRTVTAAALGRTPAVWDTVALGHIASDADYGTSHKATSAIGGVPVVRIPNIRSRTLNLTELKYVPVASVKDSQRLRRGDVLFIRSNGSPTLIGVAAAVTGSASGHTFASYLIRFRLVDDVLAKWVEVVALAPSRRKWLIEQASSSAGQNNLGQPDIAAMPVPVPARSDLVRTLAEYERRQSSLDAARDAITRQLTRCAAARSSILRAAFTGQLVPQNPSDEPASLLLERVTAQHQAGLLTKKAARKSRAKKETTK